MLQARQGFFFLVGTAAAASVALGAGIERCLLVLLRLRPSLLLALLLALLLLLTLGLPAQTRRLQMAEVPLEAGFLLQGSFAQIQAPWMTKPSLCFNLAWARKLVASVLNPERHSRRAAAAHDRPAARTAALSTSCLTRPSTTS